MKGDMAGGAAVVGAFRALSGRHPHRLLALVPLAENAIGPGSYRNDDIVKLHSGRTVEINNTDAEGRILLADAASHAVRTLGADVVIEAATLTGAQGVATGRRHAAVVSNVAALERLAVDVGLATGDLCHPLIFAPEIFQREFRSVVADMKNSVKDRSNAQSSCAAQFVWSHLDGAGADWLHVDMAYPAHADELGTGFGVALMAGLVEKMA
jgi:probable aminopeptidase NPEPL1